MISSLTSTVNGTLMSDSPEFIILPCKEELLTLKSLVAELDMPVVDMDSVVMCLEEAIRVADDQHVELSATAFHMAGYEDLFENEEIDNAQRERVYQATLQLGKQLKNKLASYCLYENGCFNYEFKRFLNEDTLIFSKQHESPISSSTHPENN